MSMLLQVSRVWGRPSSKEVELTRKSKCQRNVTKSSFVCAVLLYLGNECTPSYDYSELGEGTALSERDCQVMRVIRPAMANLSARIGSVECPTCAGEGNRSGPSKINDAGYERSFDLRFSVSSRSRKTFTRRIFGILRLESSIRNRFASDPVRVMR